MYHITADAEHTWRNYAKPWLDGAKGKTKLKQKRKTKLPKYDMPETEHCPRLYEKVKYHITISVLASHHFSPGSSAKLPTPRPI